MVAYSIDPQKTALLVIDMINDFVKPGAPRENPEIREKLIPRLKKLILHCRAKGIPVIYACHTHRKDGSDLGVLAQALPGTEISFIRGSEGVEVYAEIKPEEGDIVIEKHKYGAFYGTELELILRSMGKDTLIITGTATNLSCETAARDATNRDFKVVFPSDGNVARDLHDMGWGPIPKEEIQRVVLSTMAYRFARVLSIDELIAELG